MHRQLAPIEANQSEPAVTPPVAASSSPAAATPPTAQSIAAPVESAKPTPATASEPPLCQPLPINANKPNTAQTAQPDSPAAAAPRHKPVSAGPISTVISRLEPQLRHELDQAIMQHYPGMLSETYEKFDLRQRGISLSALYRYARRVRLHASVHDVTLLAPPDGQRTIQAMCLHLDAQFLEIVEHDSPRIDDLQRLASVRRQLTSSHLQQIRAEEIAQRMAAAAPVAAPILPTTPAGRHPPAAPTSPIPTLPQIDKEESELSPLARGDQGGFDQDTKQAPPAIGTTNDAPQPPSAPTPAAQGSPPQRTHKMFGGGPWKPRIDPAIEDAEDEANRKAGRPIPFDFDP